MERPGLSAGLQHDMKPNGLALYLLVRFICGFDRGDARLYLSLRIRRVWPVQDHLERATDGDPPEHLTEAQLRGQRLAVKGDHLIPEPDCPAPCGLRVRHGCGYAVIRVEVEAEAERRLDHLDDVLAAA